MLKLNVQIMKKLLCPLKNLRLIQNNLLTIDDTLKVFFFSV